MKFILFKNSYGNAKFSCPSSDAISASLLDKLQENGIERAKSLDDTDLFIYIGCAALGTSLDNFIKDMKDIVGYSKTVKNMDVLVTGCVTKLDGLEDVLNKFGVKVINDKDYVTAIMNYVLNKDDESNVRNVINNNIQSYALDNDVFLSVSIEDGCTNKCSFCKTNYLNSKVESLPYDELLEELRKRISNGCRVIDLHGENLSLYGLDLEGKPILHRLLQDLSKENDLLNIHLGEVTVTNMYDELLDEIINNPKVSLVSLQLETSSDRLLKLMRRGYDIDKYDYVVRRLSEANKGINTVLMTGFPTETYDDIDKTIEYIDKRNLMIDGCCSYVDCEYLPSHDLKQLSYQEKVQHRKYFLDKSRVIRTRIMMDNICNMGNSVVFRKYDNYVVSIGSSYSFCVSGKHTNLDVGQVIKDKPRTYVKRSKFLDNNSGYKF